MRGLWSASRASGPARGRSPPRLRGNQPALVSAMPIPTYADTPSRTVAALIRIPFMGGVPSVRFCVALEKNHWGAEPVPRQPDSIGNAPQRAAARVKKGPPGPPPGFVLGESGDRDL